MACFHRTLALTATLGCAAPLSAQHAGHGAQPHAAPDSARSAAAAAPERPSIHVLSNFISGPPGSTAAASVTEGGLAELRVRLTDPATGRPITGLEPMAWVDVRRGTAPTSMHTCQRGVGAYVESTLHIKHGQINMTQPVEDLNGHYIVTLSRGGTVVVIDPVKGFGRTRMLTAVPLGAEGGDWAATQDDRRIFITLPTRGEVAVLDTYTWKVEQRIQVGGSPTRARMDPDGRRLWITGAEGGVAVIDAARGTVLARIPVGAGPYALTFSADGKTAFVTARAAARVAVIDATTLTRVAEVRTGAAPVDVAWGVPRNLAFVVDEAEGTMTALDARGNVVERVALAPGLRSIRFAPDAAEGHAGHDSHGAAEGGGKLAFVLNPRVGTLAIYDVMEKRVVRTLSGAPGPDQVAFTGSFAYIRAAGTPSVALIPLANPTSGATGPHDYFPSGSTPPGPVEDDSLGDVLVPQPGAHDAVYAVNPRERMVYSYHYMEGMPVPHGGLTTYGFTPRAVRVVSRRVRETEPGVYAATVRMDRAGSYDLIFRNPEPYLLACYPFSVAADSARDAGVRVVTADSVARLQAGRQPVRFRVNRVAGGAPVEGITDLGVLLASSDGWRERAVAVAVGDGVYEATFALREPGTYYASFEIPSRGVALRQLATALVEVRP